MKVGFKTIMCLLGTLVAAMPETSAETVILSDGTVYNGFISKQDFNTGKGEITFTSVRKTIPASQIISRRANRTEWSKLSPEWQAWAEKNNKVERVGSSKYVTLTDLVVDDNSVAECYVLLSGTKSIEIFQFQNSVCVYNLSEVRSVKKEERDATLLTDVDDVVQTDNATYTGVILEQIPGSSISIWSKEDRTIHSIAYKEIRTLGKTAFNADYSLWEQTPYLERLVIKDNTTGAERTTAAGLIINNGFDSAFNVLFLAKGGQSSEARQYSNDDIVAVLKERNKDYREEHDMILPVGDAFLNRIQKLNFSDVGSVVESGTSFFFCNPADSIAVVDTNCVNIEANIDGINEIFVAAAKQHRDVKKDYLYPSNDKKSKKSVDKCDVWVYTNDALMSSSIEVAKSVSINGTTKISFTLPAPGCYVVYLRRLNKAWFINYNPKTGL